MRRAKPPSRSGLMRPALAAALAAGGLGLLLAGVEPAWTDDTDLFRESGANPYVFILLDTSGSMNTSVETAGCPSSGCVARLGVDDPDAKIRVAKEVLHDLMDQARDVNFGFATFNQDQLRTQFKHWWYELRNAAGNTGIPLGTGRSFPEPGRQDLFGQTWACTSGGADNAANANPPDSRIGCLSGGVVTPADVDDPWEAERMKRLPKLGDGGTTSVTFYVRDAGDTFRVIYSNPTGVTQRPGDASLRVQVRVDRCNNAACSAITALSGGTKTLTFDKREELIYWEPGEGVGRAFPKVAYFGNGVRFLNAGNGCSGWDPNGDDVADRFNGVNLKHDTQNDPDGRGNAFRFGDVLPLDWKGRPHRNDVKLRMSPQPGVPDFGVASYFEDHPRAGESFLRLKNPNRRPMFPDGGTPTGQSMEDFHDWYATWKNTATGNQGDKSFNCRKSYLLVLTDGLASCGEQNVPAGGEPLSCVIAKRLREDHEVRTYVVGLGDLTASTPGFVNNLTCMADNGGTGPGDVNGDGKPDGPGPLLPQNKQQLADDLAEIIKQIRAESRTFASAAVPSVQAEAQDKTYLSSFSPRNDASYWPGRLDAYLKPVPSITVNGRQLADRNQICGPGDTSECRLWDAGFEMLGQAPDPADLAAATPDFKIGTGADQRRVFYTFANPGGAVPAPRRSFEPPADAAGQADLVAAMGAADFAEVVDVLKNTLVKKTADINDPITNDPITIDFVLGDIFHSDPQVVGAPNRFRYFAEDASTAPCTAASTRYRCFFQRHEHRRKMLIVGANDGQFHAFDAGLPVKRMVGGNLKVDFGNGTGKELFAFVPREALPAVRRLSQGTLHELSVDGSPLVDDVFIDPTNSLLDPPDEDEREWRTVVLGGMREGGRGYYALDVTQPDRFDAQGVPEALGGTYVPSCTSGGADCGTLPFPSVLWEFTDTADEDGNGAPDLGDTWSKPNTGRIRVVENGRPAVKFVAVFGGGLDAVYKQEPVDPSTGAAREPSGNFLYMVDVETGRILYKRRLDLVAGATIPASAPSEPAAVDTDQDGFLETVYIGNTAGYLYKADLRVPGVIDAGTGRIASPEWEPFAVFSTGGRPMYFPPSVLFVGSLGQYALAFGTGDREDLWSESNQEGRFYVLLDDDWNAANSLPLRTELNYVGISAELSVDPNQAEGTNFLASPPPGKDAGYFLRLGVKERVITRAFALAGVTVFSSYVPEDRPEGNLCAQGGESHLFVVLTTNGNSVLTVGTPARASRYRVVQDLVTSPYVEQSVTKNRPAGGGTPSPTSNPCTGMENVTRTLQGLLPANCRFANYTTNLMTIRSDTGIECIAPVPICIVEKNWKEF